MFIDIMHHVTDCMQEILNLGFIVNIVGMFEHSSTHLNLTYWRLNNIKKE